MTLRPDIPLPLIRVPRLSVRALIDRIARANAHYRQMQTLQRLDDHLLRDVGITPSDVRREVRRSIWQ